MSTDKYLPAEVPSAMNVQIGGDHYKKYAIQPMEYGQANKLPPCEFSIVKYVTRWRDKGGLKDLEKARHCLDMLIELEGVNAERVDGQDKGTTTINSSR